MKSQQVLHKISSRFFRFQDFKTASNMFENFETSPSATQIAQPRERYDSMHEIVCSFVCSMTAGNRSTAVIPRRATLLKLRAMYREPRNAERGLLIVVPRLLVDSHVGLGFHNAVGRPVGPRHSPARRVYSAPVFAASTGPPCRNVPLFISDLPTEHCAPALRWIASCRVWFRVWCFNMPAVICAFFDSHVFPHASSHTMLLLLF